MVETTNSSAEERLSRSEDLVRNIAIRARKHEKLAWFKVEAENFESIHNHNAYASIEQHLNC